MIKAVENTKWYFQSPANYFWQWAENTDVIEWRNGVTICYRNDLIAILKELSTDGLPPLSPLLLVLSACQRRIEAQEKMLLMRTMIQGQNYLLKGMVDSVVKFLDVIDGLPPELKKGRSRIHLIHEVFEKPALIFSNALVNEALDELSSGRLDDIIIKDGDIITAEQYITDLNYFKNALEKYPTTSKLELKLRSGLEEMPVPAEIDLPDSMPADLIEQLAQDIKTIGVARLTSQLIPVLNIPSHSQQSGDQSYGGISDITNRGNYDKLLLSELAYDDLLLTARLVNNEALYFRREEPPDNPKRQRTILVDVTLKMWGIPRVFAISAALAFARNSKHHELIEAYALGGEKYSEINLGSKEGIIKALEQMHHSLHCGKCLQTLIREMPADDQNEYILITDARMFNTLEFLASLQIVKPSLSFIITVNRNGEVRFFECIKGNTKEIGKAKLDLEELLFAPSAIHKKVQATQNEAPAFLSQIPAPLLFPKVRIKQTLPERMFVMEGFASIVVNQSQRVLLFRDKDKGALELLSYIEKGIYAFGWNKVDYVYILVRNSERKLVRFYKINTTTFEVKSYNLSDEILIPTEAEFNENHFYIATQHSSFMFDCEKCEVTGKKEYAGYNYKIQEGRNRRRFEQTQEILDQHFASKAPYSVMQKVKRICVSDEGKLMIGNYTLDLTWNNNNIRIHENTTKKDGSKYAKATHNELKFISNPDIRFHSWKWEDGSTAIVDSRGLLHLKSSDKALPEITIVMITGNHTACWASDGVASGSSYFIPETISSTIHVEQFYPKYIQPFMDRLI